MLNRIALVPAASVAILLAVGCQAQPAEVALSSHTRVVRVGETDVQLVITEGRPGLTFLVLHDDENTAVEAGIEVIRRHGGRLIEVRAAGERNVRFEQGGRTYAFDPNRVFTVAGARETLRRQSPSGSSAAALDAVRRFAREVVDLGFDSAAPAVVTLHNNTDGAYSANSYALGGEFATDATAMHVPLDGEPDDFFFVTDSTAYSALHDRGFSVVLQNNATVTDDGSLSVWAGRRGLPYVNVEAEHGHLEQQIEMIEAVVEVLGVGH
jgi:hypothetical protein